MRPSPLAVSLTLLALASVALPPRAEGGVRVNPETKAGAAACGHLTRLWAIENRAAADLDRGRVRVRCGPLRLHRGVATRGLRVMRWPAREATAWLDRITGRLWGLDVPLLPAPQAGVRRGGWPAFDAIERSVRREAELGAQARLTHIERVFDARGGLRPGEHPYAQLVFEHVIEGATVLGDRIVARLDLRSDRLVQLRARPWHPAAAPRRRITRSRARRVALRRLRRLKAIDLPCCQPTRDGQAAEDAIGKAMSEDTSVDEVERKRLKRLMRHARITCPDLRGRRVFAPDVKGRLTEAWQFRCVPVCRVKRRVRRCKESEAALVYVTTERGRVMGMKGQLAPRRQNWKPGLPPSPAPMRDPVLERRARNALRRAVRGIEPTAEYAEVSCPRADVGARIFRLCWKVAFTSERWVARVHDARVSFVAVGGAEDDGDAVKGPDRGRGGP